MSTQFRRDSSVSTKVWQAIDRVRKFIFAYIYPWLVTTFYNTDGIASIKTDLFAPLALHRDTGGSVAAIRSASKNSAGRPSVSVGPRVLELGVGPGANFQFYPAGCRLTLVDPNPYFDKQVREISKRYPDIKVERTLIGYGEDLSEIKSETMDAVVLTMVLCSCRDTEAVLREIHRVLRPGGTYYFMEHVLGDAGSVHNIAQRLFNSVWKLVGHGCHINRQTGDVISRAGFASVTMQRMVVPIRQPLRLFVGPHIVGSATK